MNIGKRIISVILSVTILISSYSYAAVAEEKMIYGNIKISIIGGNENSYSVKIKGDEVYLSTEDIASITGYKCEVDKNITYIKADGIEVNTAIYIDFDGKTEAMKEEYQLEVVKEEGEYYLPLEEMLYLTHATWCVEDSVLIVSQMEKNIFDFSMENLITGEYDITDKSELFIEGNNISSAFTDTLIYALRNFDSRLYVPMLAAGSLTDEQYEKALMQLTENDNEFLGGVGEEMIKQQLEGSLFSQLSKDAKNLQFMTESIDNISNIDEAIEIVDKSSNIAKKITDTPDLSGKEIKQISKLLSRVGTVSEWADILCNINEMAHWSEKMGQDFLRELQALRKIDETKNYYTKSLVKSIKRASQNLINRTQPELKNWEVTKDMQVVLVNKLIEKGVDLTPLGQMIGGMQLADRTLSIFSEDYTNFMQAHELSYTTKFLVDLEVLSSMEMWLYYYKVNSQKFTAKDLEDFRTYLSMMFKLNIRTQFLVYKINELKYANTDWKNTNEAKEIQKIIAQSYALSCQLKSTENMDKRLLLGEFKDMFSNKEGFTRVNIPVSLVKISEKPNMDTVTGKEEIYNVYAEAYRKTIESGQWNEKTTMDASVKLKSDTASSSYQEKLKSDLTVSGYNINDLYNIKIDGNCESKIANSKMKYEVHCADGKMQYIFSKPENRTETVNMEKLNEEILKFYLFEEQYLTDFKMNGNEISFVADEKGIPEGRILAMNTMGMQNVEYSDIHIKMRINETTGKIEKIYMKFSAKFIYQGYDAEADYTVEQLLS
ncbi:MAG: hypothetical protein Q4B89_00620 [Lachnospiraceae bacterium]|nr:hypothetical protein [Lachnospiraceae bacterium]